MKTALNPAVLNGNEAQFVSANLDIHLQGDAQHEVSMSSDELQRAAAFQLFRDKSAQEKDEQVKRYTLACSK